MLDLRGHLAPLVSPFTDDGSGVSEIRLARLVRRLVAQSVGGFVTCTETGEFTCLSFSERKFLLEVVVRECQGALPVVAHVSTLSTGSSLDLAQHAQRHGARCVVMMPPYYGRFTQTEIEWHFKTVAQYADIPVICVDPQNLISADLRVRMEEIGRLFFTEGVGGRPDRFLFGGADASPHYGIPTDLGRQAAMDLLGLCDTHGSAKVIKAALEELEIEVALPRKPLQALEREARDEIVRLLASK